MPKEFARLQAQDMGKIGAVQDLVRGVEKLIPRKNNQQINGGQQYVQQVIQSGGPNTKALCDRGYLSLEDNAWDKAKECFDQALNIDAKCSDAYGGLFLAEHQTGNWSKYIQSVRKRCEEVEPEQHYMILDDLGVDLTAIRSSYNKAYTGIPEMKELDKTYFVYNTRKDRISYIKSEVQNDKNFLRAKQFKNDASVTRQQNVEEEIEKLFEEYNDRSVQEEESELAKIKNMVSDWYKVESGKIVNKYVKQEEIQKLMSEKEKLENDMNDINIMKDKVESDEESCFSFSNVNWKFERDNWQPIAISVGVAIVSFIFCVFCLGVRDTAKDVFSALFRSLFFGLPMYGISCVVLCWKKSKDDKLGELEYESNARRHRIDKIEGRIKELEKEIDRNGI
jgi:tetratricopeptide (TPR) repeat protein